MNLGLEKLLVVADEIPKGVVLLWHDIVPFPQFERWAVISLPVTDVDEMLLLVTGCCLDPLDYLALHMVSTILVHAELSVSFHILKWTVHRDFST